MFLQSYVHVVLDAVLGSYVKNIDPEALKIHVWNGKIEVDVVELRPDALPLPPEFRIVKCTLHQVRIDLPWSNLANQPIRVEVQDVSLLMEVCDRRATSASSGGRDVMATTDASVATSTDEMHQQRQERRRADTLKRKRATIDAIEKATQYRPEEAAASAKPSSSSALSWTHSLFVKLLLKVLDNVQLNIQRIHLRLEDAVSDPTRPFAVGITLDSMVIKSADEGWNYTMVLRGGGQNSPSTSGAAASFLRKKIDITRFGLYWSLPLVPVPQSARDDAFAFVKLMQMGFWSEQAVTSTTAISKLFQADDYLIKPLTLSLKLTVNDGNAKLPITHQELSTRVMARLGTPWMMHAIDTIGDDAWREFVQMMPQLAGGRQYTLSFVFSEAWAVARELTEEEDVVPSVEQFKEALSSCLQWSLSEVERLEDTIITYRDAVVHVMEEKSTYLDASASIDRITVALQRQQYLSALSLVSFIGRNRRQARYAHLRPDGDCRVLDSPRRWWRYAIGAVLIDVRERLARVDWEKIKADNAKRIRYREVYLTLSHPAPMPDIAIAADVQKMSKEELRGALDELELEFDIQELLKLRSMARQSLPAHKMAATNSSTEAAPHPMPVGDLPQSPRDAQSKPKDGTPAPADAGWWGYTSWMYGGVTSSDRTGSGGGERRGYSWWGDSKTDSSSDIEWSDNDTRSLYAAINFNPEKDALPNPNQAEAAEKGGATTTATVVPTSSDAQDGQHIWYRLQLTLGTTGFTLHGDDNSSLLTAALSDVETKVLVRPSSVELGILLRDAFVSELLGDSAHSQEEVPRSLLLVQRMTVNEIMEQHPKTVYEKMSSVRLRNCERDLPLIDISVEVSRGSSGSREIGDVSISTVGGGEHVGGVVGESRVNAGKLSSSMQGVNVSVVTQAIKCDINVQSLLQISGFFSRPRSVDLSGLHARASAQARSLQQYSTAQLRAAVARRSKVKVMIDIVSPVITVMESKPAENMSLSTMSQKAHLQKKSPPPAVLAIVMFLGHFRAVSRRHVDNILNEESNGDRVPDDHVSGLATENSTDVVSPTYQDRLYDIIDLGVSGIEVRLRKGLQSVVAPTSDRSPRLLEKTSIHLSFFVSITPDDPTIPLVKLTGGVESVTVNLGAESFSQLLQLARSVVGDLSAGRTQANEDAEIGGANSASDGDIFLIEMEREVDAQEGVRTPGASYIGGETNESERLGASAKSPSPSDLSSVLRAHRQRQKESESTGRMLYGAIARALEGDDKRSDKAVSDNDLLKLWKRVLGFLRFRIREIAINLELETSQDTASRSKMVHIRAVDIKTELQIRTFDKRLDFALGSFNVEEVTKNVQGAAVLDNSAAGDERLISRRFLIASGDQNRIKSTGTSANIAQQLIRLGITSVDMAAPKPSDISKWRLIRSNDVGVDLTPGHNFTVWQDPLLTRLSIDARLQTLTVNVHQSAFADLFLFFFGKLQRRSSVISDKSDATEEDANHVKESPNTSIGAGGLHSGLTPVKAASGSPPIEQESVLPGGTPLRVSARERLTSKIGTWMASSLASKNNADTAEDPEHSRGDDELLSRAASIQLRVHVAGLSVILHTEDADAVAPPSERASTDNTQFVSLVAENFCCCLQKFPTRFSVFAYLLSMKVRDETVPDPELRDILTRESELTDNEGLHSSGATTSDFSSIPSVDDVLAILNSVPGIFSCAAQLYGADRIQERWHPGYSNRVSVRLRSPRIRVLSRFLDELRGYFVDGVLLSTVTSVLFQDRAQFAWEKEFLLSTFADDPSTATTPLSPARQPPSNASMHTSELVSMFPLLDVRVVDAMLHVPVHRTSTEALVVRCDDFRLSNEYLVKSFATLRDRAIAKVLLNSSLAQFKMDTTALRVVSIILADPLSAQRDCDREGHGASPRGLLLKQSLMGSTNVVVSFDMTGGAVTTVGFEFSPVRVVCSREQYAFLLRLPIQNVGEARRRRERDRLRYGRRGISPVSSEKLADFKSQHTSQSKETKDQSVHDDIVTNDRMSEKEVEFTDAGASEGVSDGTMHELEIDETERELLVTVTAPEFSMEILHGQEGYQPSVSGDITMAERDKKAQGSICSVDVSGFTASATYGLSSGSLHVTSDVRGLHIRDTRRDADRSSTYRDVVLLVPTLTNENHLPSISIRLMHGPTTTTNSSRHENPFEWSYASPHRRKSSNEDNEHSSDGRSGDFHHARRRLSFSLAASETMVSARTKHGAKSSQHGENKNEDDLHGDKAVGSETGTEQPSGGTIGGAGTSTVDSSHPHSQCKPKERKKKIAREPSLELRTDLTVDIEGFRVIPSNIHYDLLQFLEKPGTRHWPAQDGESDTDDTPPSSGSTVMNEAITQNSLDAPEEVISKRPQLPHRIVLSLSLGPSAVMLVEDPKKVVSRAVMFSWEAGVTVDFLRRIRQLETQDASIDPKPTASENTNNRLQIHLDLANIQATSRLSSNDMWVRGDIPTQSKSRATRVGENFTATAAGDFLKPCDLDCHLDVDFSSGFVRFKAAFDRVLELRFGYLDVMSIRSAIEKMVEYPVVSAVPRGVVLSRRFSAGSSVASSTSTTLKGDPVVNGKGNFAVNTMTSATASLSGEFGNGFSRRGLRPRRRRQEEVLVYGSTLVHLVSSTFRGPINVRPAVGLYSSPWRKRYLVLPFTAQERQSVEPVVFRMIPASGSGRKLGDPIRYGDNIALQSVSPANSSVASPTTASIPNPGNDNSDGEASTRDPELVPEVAAASDPFVCKYDQLGASGYLGPDGSAGIFETRIWKYGTSVFNTDRSPIRHKDAIILEELTIYRAFSKGKHFGNSRVVNTAPSRSTSMDPLESRESATISDGGGYLMFDGVGDAPIPFVISVVPRDTTAIRANGSHSGTNTNHFSSTSSNPAPATAQSRVRTFWRNLKVIHISLPGVNATVVNDFHNMLLPLLHVRLVQLRLDVRGVLDAKSTAMAGLQIGIQGYNSQLAVWEPIVEDFDVNVALHVKGGTVCSYCMSDRRQIPLVAGTKLRCAGLPSCLFATSATAVFASATARAAEAKHFIYQELLEQQDADHDGGDDDDDARAATTCLVVIKKGIHINVSRNGINVLLHFVDLVGRATSNAEDDAWRSRLGAFIYVDNQSGIPFMIAAHPSHQTPSTGPGIVSDPSTGTEFSQPVEPMSEIPDDSVATVKMPSLSVGSEESVMSGSLDATSMPIGNSKSAWSNRQLSAVLRDLLSSKTSWVPAADGERVATTMLAHEAPAGSVTSPLRRLLWVRPLSALPSSSSSSSPSSKPIPVPIGYSNRSYLHLESADRGDRWRGESIICETVAEQGTLIMRLRGKVQVVNHLSVALELVYNDNERRVTLAENGQSPHFVPIQFLDGRSEMTLCPVLDNGRLQPSTALSIDSLLTRSTNRRGHNRPNQRARRSVTQSSGAIEMRQVLTFYWDVHPDPLKQRNMIDDDDEYEDGYDDDDFAVARPPFQVVVTTVRKSEKHETLVTISPPIRIENLVPFALSFRSVCVKSPKEIKWVQGSSASFSGTSGVIASGSTAQICELEMLTSGVETFEANSRTSTSSLAGGSRSIQVPATVGLSVAIPGIGCYAFSRWSEDSLIYGSNAQCRRIEIIPASSQNRRRRRGGGGTTSEEEDDDEDEDDDIDEDGDKICPLQLRVEIVQKDRLGVAAFNAWAPSICRIYAEYWLIDRTCLSLRMRTTDGRRVVSCPMNTSTSPSNAPVALFSGTKASHAHSPTKIKVGVSVDDDHNGGILGRLREMDSDAFDISTVGLRGRLVLRKPGDVKSSGSGSQKAHKQYDIGVMIEQGPSIFTRTTIVTFVPRYYFINTSTRFHVCVKQDGQDDSADASSVILLPPKQGCFFHWNDHRLRRRVQLRFVCMHACEHADLEEKDYLDDASTSGAGDEQCDLMHGHSEWSLPFEVSSVGNMVVRLQKALTPAASFLGNCYVSDDAHNQDGNLTDGSDECEVTDGMALHVGVELHDPAFVVRFHEGTRHQGAGADAISSPHVADHMEEKDFVPFKLKNECSALELVVWQKINPVDIGDGGSAGENLRMNKVPGTTRVYEGGDHVLPFHTVEFIPYAASAAPTLFVQVQTLLDGRSGGYTPSSKRGQRAVNNDPSQQSKDGGESSRAGALNSVVQSAVIRGSEPRVVTTFEISLGKLHRLPIVEVQDGKNKRRLWVEVLLDDATKTLHVTDVLPGASREHKRRRRTALLRSWKRYNASILWYSQLLTQQTTEKRYGGGNDSAEGANLDNENEAKRKKVRFADEDNDTQDDQSLLSLTNPASEARVERHVVVGVRVLECHHLEDLYPEPANSGSCSPFLRVAASNSGSDAAKLRNQASAVFPRWLPTVSDDTGAKREEDSHSFVSHACIVFPVSDTDKSASDLAAKGNHDQEAKRGSSGAMHQIEIQVRESNTVFFGSSLIGRAVVPLEEYTRNNDAHGRVFDVLVPLLAVDPGTTTVESTASCRAMVRLHIACDIFSASDVDLTKTLATPPRRLLEIMRDYSVEHQLDNLIRCKSQLKMLLEREAVDISLGDTFVGASSRSSAPTSFPSPSSVISTPSTMSPMLGASVVHAAEVDSSQLEEIATSVATDESVSDAAVESLDSAGIAEDERLLNVVVIGVSKLQLPVPGDIVLSSTQDGDDEHDDGTTHASATALEADRKVYYTVSFRNSTRSAMPSVAKPSVPEASLRSERSSSRPRRKESSRGGSSSRYRRKRVRTHTFTAGGPPLGLDLIYHNGRVIVQGVACTEQCGQLLQDGAIRIGDTVVAVNGRSIVNLHREASFRAIAQACAPPIPPPQLPATGGKGAKDHDVPGSNGTFSLSFLDQSAPTAASDTRLGDGTTHNTRVRSAEFDAEWNRRVEFEDASIDDYGTKSDASHRGHEEKVLIRVYQRHDIAEHGISVAQEASVVPFLYFFGDDVMMDHLDHSKQDTRFDTLIGECWVPVPSRSVASASWPTSSGIRGDDGDTDGEGGLGQHATDCVCALYAPPSQTMSSSSSSSSSSAARTMVGQVRVALQWGPRSDSWRRKQQNDEALRAYLQLDVQNVFVSIIDDGLLPFAGAPTGSRSPREVLSISMSDRHAEVGIQVSYGLITDGRHVVNTRIGHLQVDNQLLDTNYPVMVYPMRLTDTAHQEHARTLSVGTQDDGTGRSGVRPDVTPTVSGRATTSGTSTAASNDRILLPTFQLMGVFSMRRRLIAFEYIFAQLQELDVKVEDAILVATAQAFSGVQWTGEGRGRQTDNEREKNGNNSAVGTAMSLVDERWPFPTTAKFSITMLNVAHRGNSRKVLLRWLLLCPIKTNITFTSTTDRSNLLSLLSPEMSSVLRATISAAAALVSNLDNAPINVPEFYVENLLETTHTLAFYAIQHYLHNGLRSWYRIVGSVDFLGNPIGLVSALGTGVKDFFYTPAQMLLEDENGLRIENLRTGMTKGSKSLLRNTAVGILHTTGKITETLGRGISLLAMDDQYNVQRQRDTIKQQKRIHDLGDAISEGGMGLVGGVWEGVKGVVAAPVRGAERDGAGGFMLGLGQGMAGLIVKPTAGFLDLLTSLSRGAKSSAEAIIDGGDHAYMAVTRVRLPRRMCSDGVLVTYSEREAQGCAILALTSLDATDDYVYHLGHGMEAQRGILLLTDKRVICLSAKSGQRMWEMALDSSLQVDAEGAKLRIGQAGTLAGASQKAVSVECENAAAASNFKLAVVSARMDLGATRYLLLNLEKKQEEARRNAWRGGLKNKGRGVGRYHGSGSGEDSIGLDDEGERVDLSVLMGNLQDTMVTGLTDEDLQTQPLRAVHVELCHLENKDAVANVPRRTMDSVLSFSVFQIFVYGGPYQWTIFRRFSEFRALHEALEDSGLAMDALPPLPPRTFLPSTRTHVATSRQEALSLFLQAAIMHASISSSAPMLAFLTHNAQEVRVSLPPLSPTRVGGATSNGGDGAQSIGISR